MNNTVYLHVRLDGRELAMLALPAECVVTYNDAPNEHFISVSLDAHVIVKTLAHVLPEWPHLSEPDE